jgi:outer membrane protein OmpA-like peptidoglycan-associated protein
MASNLIENIEARITPDVVDDVASSLGESPSSTKRALVSAIPTIFLGLIQKGSTASGSAQLTSELTDARAVGEAAKSTTSGSRLFTSVLGDRSASITDLIAKDSGISRPSSTSVMGFLFPVIASALGAHITSGGLGAAGLSEMLAKLSGDALRHPKLPAEAAGMLGLAEPVAAPAAVAATAPPRVPHVAPAVAARGGSRATSVAWWPVVAVLAALALVIGGIAYLTRRAPVLSSTAPSDEAPVAARPTAVIPVVPKVIPGSAAQPRGGPDEQRTAEQRGAGETQGAGEPTSTTTLTGAAMDTSSDALTKAFSDGSGAAPQRVTLPNVNFDVGTSHVASGGEASVERLATLMKAHPTAKVRLEGFTDASGDATINEPLSIARASAVKKLLVERGIPEDRIETVGRREQQPLAENTSEEGRAKNRRIDVVVLSR